MNTAKQIMVTESVYLEGEQTAEMKHEFLKGDVWVMVGASDAHVTMTGNLFYLLKQKLKGKPCRPYASDMKVQVKKEDAYFYPDVVVACDHRDHDQDYYKTHPIFIAEVLSPSTEGFDRGDKFAYYRQLDSLQEYWLISPTKGNVDCFVKVDDGDWRLRRYSCNESDSIPLPSLGFEINTDELFEDIQIEGRD